MKELKLSEELQAYIDSLEQQQSPKQRNEAEHWQPLLDAILKITIQGREALVEHNAQIVRAADILTKESPDLLAQLLDTYYSKQALEAVSDRVRRTLELSRLEGKTPSKITNGFIQEAARSYIVGHPQSCVVLCRAAMEQALKEQLGHQGTGTFIKMKKLLKDAEDADFLDNTTREMASDVAKAANDVLHEKSTSEHRAYEILIKMRGVISYLYRDER